MQLVALKYFVAMADHGSFTAAAEWLSVSASTLKLPGVAFRTIDETNARIEFSLAWSLQSECAVIGQFLASMRASAADKGVDAPAS
jgi:Bacterial regulatory helix-turn-helix protein, lysR family